jgi:hypothetical protein
VLEASRLYLPSKTSILAEHETRLDQITPRLIQRLNNIKLSASKSHRTLDLETLFNTQDISAADRQQPQYYAIIALGTTAFTAIGIMFLCVKPNIHKARRSPSGPEDMPTAQNTAEPRTEEREPALSFTSYMLQELTQAVKTTVSIPATRT